MHTILFLCNPKLLFSTLRSPFQPTLTYCPQKFPVFTNQKPFFRTNLFYCHPKHPFSTLHLPFAPSHNLLSTKERRCSFYLRSKSSRCNARISHRFKAFSPPFCAKNRFRLVPSENFAKIFSGRALNRGRRTESRVLFGYFLHDAKSDKPFPLQRTSRFSKPRISPPKQQLSTNKIKTFPKS